MPDPDLKDLLAALEDATGPFDFEPYSEERYPSDRYDEYGISVDFDEVEETLMDIAVLSLLTESDE